jgi:hypothetical protein
MGGLNEGVEIADLGPERRDAEVAALTDPWIGDEGPLDAALRRGLRGPLRQRGVAFDERTTVVWDEAGVQVLRATAPSAGVVALRSEVLLREGFQENGPARLVRIDYLRRGTLLGSRFIPERGPEGGNDA